MENLETELRYRFYDRALPFTIGNGEIRNEFGDVLGILQDGETIYDYMPVIDTLATIKPCFEQFNKLVTDISPSFIQLTDDQNTLSFDIRDSEHIQVIDDMTNSRKVEMFKENSVFYNDNGHEVSTFESSLNNLRDLILQINEKSNEAHSDVIDAFTNAGFDEVGDITAAEALNYGRIDNISELFGLDSPVIKALANSGADEYSVIVHKPEDPNYDVPYVTLHLGNKATDVSDMIMAYKFIPCNWAEDDVHEFIEDFNDFCEASRELRKRQKVDDLMLSTDDLITDDDILSQ